MTDISQGKIEASKENSKLPETKADKRDKITKLYSNADYLLGGSNILDEFRELEDNPKKLTPIQTKRRSELQSDLAMLYGLENGIWLANLSHNKYYPTLGRMRQIIVKEYNCKTPSELMLADRIIGSYWRAMKLDTVLSRTFEKEDGDYSYNQLKINMIKELNKGIELANRQLNTNIMLLKNLKQPQLKVNVKTENAYFAENQQVINEKPSNEPPMETINAK